MLAVTCPGCGMKLQVKEEHAGKQVRCPGCKDPISVALAKTRAEESRSREAPAAKRVEPEAKERVQPRPPKPSASPSRQGKQPVSEPEDMDWEKVGSAKPSKTNGRQDRKQPSSPAR